MEVGLFAAIAEATSAAIIGGLISGGVVLLGVLLAERLRRGYERRQRIFMLRLNEREVLDQFFATLDDKLERRDAETDRAADQVQAITCELEAELRRGPLPAWGKRAKRADAVRRFVLMFAAARVRILAERLLLCGQVISVVAIEVVRSQRHAVKEAYNRLSGLLPARAAGALDTALDSFRTWSGPFNGQNARQQIIRDLVFSVRIEQFVETGTFRGTTTEFLANLLGAPVFTVESQPRYFFVAKQRLAQYPWVTVELGDSRSFLRGLASKEELRGRRTLFYLDAHWERDLPLRDELAIIVQVWPNAVVVIDDFEVPDDPGYAFDEAR
jgi:predicted O-methyltransferase YrrM